MIHNSKPFPVNDFLSLSFEYCKTISWINTDSAMQRVSHDFYFTWVHYAIAFSIEANVPTEVVIERFQLLQF